MSADADTFDPLNTSAPINRRLSQRWNLDELGNWVSGGNGAGLEERVYTGSVGSDPAPALASNMGGLLITQTVNPRQELATIKASFGNTPVPAPPGAVTEVKHVYDNSGRLMSDGTYFYERDFFGRLVQVRRLSSGSGGSSGANTAPTIDPITGVWSSWRGFCQQTQYSIVARITASVRTIRLHMGQCSRRTDDPSGSTGGMLVGKAGVAVVGRYRH